MSRKPANASSFLSALNLDAPANETPAIAKPVLVEEAPRKPGRPRKASGSREGLKHIGGYLQDEAAERFARLKIRTKLGNDELLALAIDELWRIEGTKRKWED